MSKKKQKEPKPYKKKLIKRRKPNRSIAGDIGLYLFLALVAVAMGFPLVFAVSNALKPLDELFMFPPKFLAQNPTGDNFSDLFVTMGKSFVTFPRYVFNTVFITAVGTAGHKEGHTDALAVGNIIVFDFTVVHMEPSQNS